jgi:hypothetical protein
VGVQNSEHGPIVNLSDVQTNFLDMQRTMQSLTAEVQQLKQQQQRQQHPANSSFTQGANRGRGNGRGSGRSGYYQRWPRGGEFAEEEQQHQQQQQQQQQQRLNC